MNLEESKSVLWGKFLQGCPVRLLESHDVWRVPGDTVYTIMDYRVEDMCFRLLPLGDFDPLHACYAFLDDICLHADRVAVLCASSLPLFFLNTSENRVYCSPNVSTLMDLNIEVKTMPLVDLLSNIPLSGDVAVVRVPSLPGIFVGQLEYLSSGFYDVNNLYKVSDDKTSISRSDISKITVPFCDIVTFDSIENVNLVELYKSACSKDEEVVHA